MPHLLLVDDEPVLRSSLAFTLRSEGYRVTTAGDGPAGLQLARELRPDLVLLDVMLPGMDGVEVCRRIRETSDVPVVMLTARGEEHEKVLGLRTGADDYVTKPFSSRELVARIDAVLRRRRRAGSEREAADTLEGGPVRMDVARHEVWVSDQRVDLSPKEFQLLRALLSRRGRVLSRDELIQEVWGDDFMGDAKTLDVHIRWLRAKVEADPGEPKHIVTVRGVGFRFD